MPEFANIQEILQKLDRNEVRFPRTAVQSAISRQDADLPFAGARLAQLRWRQNREWGCRARRAVHLWVQWCRRAVSQLECSRCGRWRQDLILDPFR
jgi:hypothetical protein